MTSELMSLTWIVALQMIMWVPYILNTIAVRGTYQCRWLPGRPVAASRLGSTNEGCTL